MQVEMYKLNDIAQAVSDLADFSAYFEKLGKCYGLVKEFKENGII